MGSSNLKIESRETLWYSKYEYRARLVLPGINRAYGSNTYLSYLKHLKRILSPPKDDYFSTDPIYILRARNEIEEIDLDAMERYFLWKEYVKEDAFIRTEQNNLSVFSSDLPLLKTLEVINPMGGPVVYTKAIANIPFGTKYFLTEPKHKFRLYLNGCRLKNGSSFRKDLREFIARYQPTATTMVPSRALSAWLYPNTLSWRVHFCQAHYSIEYDDPSTYTLLRLMFDEMIGPHYKLEKSPAGINTP